MHRNSITDSKIISFQSKNAKEKMGGGVVRGITRSTRMSTAFIWLRTSFTIYTTDHKHQKRQSSFWPHYEKRDTKICGNNWKDLPKEK